MLKEDKGRKKEHNKGGRKMCRERESNVGKKDRNFGDGVSSQKADLGLVLSRQLLLTRKKHLIKCQRYFKP